MLIKNIAIPQKQIQDFCQRWKIREFALFGSVLQEDFRPESYIDVLVSFATDANWSLFDRVNMQDELEAIFKRKVDLVSKEGIKRSKNYIRKNNILGSAQVIYTI